MKAINANRSRSLVLNSKCFCADNSGAKEVYIISVVGFKGKKRRNPTAGISDLVNVVVKKRKTRNKKQN